MRALCRLFFFMFLVLVLGSEAYPRLPESASERSLLYWRYLCEGEPQEERVKFEVLEFKCLKQNRIVRVPASGGPVKEIIENDSP